MAGLLMLCGCDGGTPTETDTDPGLPSSLDDCADGTTLTWADAGPIFAAHCTDCHSSTLEGDGRNGAPVGVNFDTPAGASGAGFLVWSQIWLGNMPLGSSLADEDALVIWEWLSCGGPE